MKVHHILTALLLVPVVLTGCSGGNPAAGANEAFEDFSAQLAKTSTVDPTMDASTLTEATVRQWAQDTKDLRTSFETLRTELQSVDFPEEYQTRGQPAQATVDEYIAATDQYITVNEQSMAVIVQCVDAGSSPYDCVMQVGVEIMMGTYADVVQRAQNAALELSTQMSRA